jgi:hypothetical protein
MDPWFGYGVLGERQGWVFAFGMRYSAGEFTLPATDAALGVDEHSLHAGHG